MHNKMNVQGHGIRNLELEQDTQTRCFGPMACLNQMTFIHEFDMYPLKVYMHTTN